MPQRSTGTIWLVLGLLLGLVALLFLAVGAFSIWHTHGNVRRNQDFVDRSVREMEQLRPMLHLPHNRVRGQELSRQIEFGLAESREYKFWRNTAFAIACSSILPGILALVFLGIFAMKRRQGGKPVGSD